jgi:hypothetical protein
MLERKAREARGPAERPIDPTAISVPDSRVLELQ